MISLALAVVVAAMASLNVALPDIARDTHASQTDLQQDTPAAAAAGSPTRSAKTA